MKKLLIAALMLAPTATFAATYHYVDTSGTVRTVNADSAAEAYVEATAIAPHSGVALDQGVLDSGDAVGGSGDASVPGANQYHYVDTSGTVRTVNADSAAQAYVEATAIAPHSGVAVDQNVVESGDHVSL